MIYSVTIEKEDLIRLNTLRGCVNKDVWMKQRPNTVRFTGFVGRVNAKGAFVGELRFEEFEGKVTRVCTWDELTTRPLKPRRTRRFRGARHSTEG